MATAICPHFTKQSHLLRSFLLPYALMVFTAN